ncbi:MAG: hypothetical protein SFX73_02970 [Kofleriaceae bacterium]|nr:hypothetical protein [Kofleriaceae bacterium]
MTRVEMAAAAVEARLSACAVMSLDLDVAAPRVDMSPAAVEARLAAWAEMSALCLELTAARREDRAGRAHTEPDGE